MAPTTIRRSGSKLKLSITQSKPGSDPDAQSRIAASGGTSKKSAAVVVADDLTDGRRQSGGVSNYLDAMSSINGDPAEVNPTHGRGCTPR
jgi:hypothetical protein